VALSAPTAPLALLTALLGRQVLEEDVIEGAWREICRRHPEVAHTLYATGADHFRQVRPGPELNVTCVGLRPPPHARRLVP
jgi:hypothetical protein